MLIFISIVSPSSAVGAVSWDEWWTYEGISGESATQKQTFFLCAIELEANQTNCTVQRSFHRVLLRATPGNAPVDQHGVYS